jgi:hypothetical protein
MCCLSSNLNSETSGSSETSEVIYEITQHHTKKTVIFIATVRSEMCKDGNCNICRNLRMTSRNDADQTQKSIPLHTRLWPWELQGTDHVLAFYATLVG